MIILIKVYTIHKKYDHHLCSLQHKIVSHTPILCNLIPIKNIRHAIPPHALIVSNIKLIKHKLVTQIE